MPKKKPSTAGKLWQAWVWAASHLLHLFYLLAKSIILLMDVVLAKYSAGAKKSAMEGKMPRAGASYSPLLLQKQSSGDLAAFEDRLLASKSTIGIVLGSRGSGKSALGMRLMENIHAKTSRKVCAMGFDESTVPPWIQCVDGIDEVPNGAFVLVDEGGIAFSSRSSQSSANKILSSLLLVARHKDMSALFISQNSANLEVNAIRQADFLLLRKPSLLQQDFERRKIAEIYEKAGAGFSSLPSQGKYSTYIYSDEFCGFVANELPSFWSLGASKPYSSYKPKESIRAK